MESTSQNTPQENDLRGLLSIIVLPTDKAWVVVFVAMCQNFLLESVPLTLLILGSDMQHHDLELHQKYRNVAIFFGFTSIFTPLSCSLLNWYSFKAISVVGPTIIILSMVVTYLFHGHFNYTLTGNFLTIFSLGIIGGFGNSMINATSICLPTIWFCNKRDMACQLSNFGQSFGILFLPWFTKDILMGIFEFSIDDLYLVYAAMYIPLIALAFAIPKCYGISLEVLNSKKKSRTRVKFRDQETAAILAKSMSVFRKKLSYAMFKNLHNLMFPRVKDIIKNRSLNILVPGDDMTACADPPYKKNIPHRHGIPIARDSSSVSFSFYGIQDIQLLKTPSLKGYGCRPFYRVDIFYTSEVTELYIYIRQTNQLDYHMAVSRAMSKKDYQEEIEPKCCVFPEAIFRALVSLLHIGIWKQFYSIILQIALAFFYFGYFIPFIFINDRTLESGHTEIAFTMVICVAAGNLICRSLVFFFTTFFFRIESDIMFLFVVSCEGCFSMLSNFFAQSGLQLTYGFCTGFFMHLTAIAMVPFICRIIGISNLTNAIGHMFVFKGIGIITGTLVCVYINERHETVKYSFFISGLCMLITILLVLPLKKLKFLVREGATDLV